MAETLQKVYEKLKSCPLLIGTLAGVLVGLILGFGLKPLDPDETTKTLLSFPGELFIRSLQLLILPVVIFSLIVGSASLNVKSNGKIALRTLSYFLATSFFNAILGIILVVLIHPGDTSIKQTVHVISAVEERKNSLFDNFMDLGRNIVPNNIFIAFFQQTTTIYYETQEEGVFAKRIENRPGTNSLGVIAYSLSIGIVIAILGDKAKHLLDVAKAIDEVNMKTITGLIWLTPIGVASIICAKILEVKEMAAIMAALAMFIFTVAIGILLYQLIFMQLIYFLFIRKNPYKFYVGVLPAAITGFAADSSSAALPVSLRCLDENHVDPRVSHFVVPVGVTVNMDGTALFTCIASIFIAQMNGITLGFGDYLNVCVAGVAVSVATAGAPSASLTLLFIILNAINAPTHDIGLLFAIDWFVDRMRTTNNILGDCYAAAVVDHLSRKELDGMKSRKESNIPEIQLENML